MKRVIKGVSTVLNRELAENATLLLVGILGAEHHIHITHEYKSEYLIRVYDLANQEIIELELDTNELCYLESELFVELDNYLVGDFINAKRLFNPLLKELILESLYQVLSHQDFLDEKEVLDSIEKRLTRKFQAGIHRFSIAMEGYL